MPVDAGTCAGELNGTKAAGIGALVTAAVADGVSDAPAGLAWASV